MNSLTEIVFVLDRSGSMHGMEEDTIGGFNSMLEQQKAESGDAVLSAVLFSSSVRVLYDRVDLNDVPPLTEKDYRVGGGTALLDAIGGAVHHIARVHRRLPEESRPGKTVFVIITDGMENASRHYSLRKVREMVEHEQEKYGWEFLFLGAELDSIRAARSYGIRADRAARYTRDRRGTELNYRVVSETIANVRHRVEITPDWSADIEEDVRSRNGNDPER